MRRKNFRYILISIPILSVCSLAILTNRAAAIPLEGTTTAGEETLENKTPSSPSTSGTTPTPTTGETTSSPPTDVCTDPYLKEYAGCNDDAKNKVNTFFSTLFNVILGIIGMVCTTVIIIGGVQLMTSTGDPSKVQKAKNTILYGVIGLVVVAFAAVITNFVIDQINKAN